MMGFEVCSTSLCLLSKCIKLLTNLILFILTLIKSYVYVT